MPILIPFGVIHVGVSLALAAILVLVYRRLSRTDFLLYWALYWVDIAVTIAAVQVAAPALSSALIPIAPTLMICAGLSAGRMLSKRIAWRCMAGAGALGILLAVYFFLRGASPVVVIFGATATGLALFFFAWQLAVNGRRQAGKARTGLVALSLLYGVHNLLLGLGVYGAGGDSPWAATAGILFQLCLTIVLTYGAIESAGEASRESSWVLTDLFKAQGELREREEKLRVIFNSNQDLQLLVRIEPGGRFVIEAFNQAYADWATQYIAEPKAFLGRDRDELLRAVGMPEDEVEKAGTVGREAAAKKTPLRFELTYTLDAGQRREIGELSIVPILNRDGECTHLLWTGHFITERRRAEEELRKRERELAEAQRIGHIGSWTWDMEEDKLAWSDEMFRILGYEPGQFPPAFPSFLDRVHPEEREDVERASWVAFEARTPHDIEHRIVRPDGTERFVHTKSVIQLDSSGRPLRLLGTIHDVTEERQSAAREERRLRRLKQLSELSMMLAGDPITVFERIVGMIGELFDVRGVCLSEVVGHDLAFRAVYAGGKPTPNAKGCALEISPCATVAAAKDIRIYERVQELFPRAGYLRDFDAYFWCGFPSLDNQGNVVAVTSLVDDKPREFTEEDQQILRVIGQRIAAEFDRGKSMAERARMEEELRENERRLEEAQHMATLGSYTGDGVSSRMEWSDEMYRIYEVDAAERSPALDVVMARAHPDDRARIQETHAGLLAGTGHFDVEHRLLMPDGRIKYVLVRGTSKPGADGRPWIRGTVQDISERKRAEQEKAKLQGQLSQAQKMESIGRLAGGVAHDFNNLLTVINGYSDALMHQLDGPVRRYAEQINKAGEAAASLTRQLLAFSRMEATHPEPVRLNDIVAETRDMLECLLGEHIEMKTSLSTSPGEALADPSQIQQCLMNLVVNARDAMPAGGRLTIETGNDEVAPADIPIGSTAAAGPHVRLTVRDTGTGMDEETCQRIFEPFFTTKEKGRGTGLGLSTVYGIVSQWHGFIKVASEPGRGSEFSIYLPVNTLPVNTGAAQVESDPEVKTGGPRTAWETLLVVDDQDMVREYIVESLREYGYTVLEARNGAQALRLIESYGPGIHLMVTDIMMPGMGGKELAARANAACSSIKVLFMTGYAHGSLNGSERPVGGDEVIMKPFAPEALESRVRSLLAETGSLLHAE